MTATLPRFAAGLLALAVCVLLGSGSVFACVFCAKLGKTLAEDIGESDVAVVARLTSYTPPETSGTSAAEKRYLQGVAKFIVTRQAKDSPDINRDQELTVRTSGELTVGKKYLLTGFKQERDIEWARPTELSEKAEQYLIASRFAAKEGAARLEFFVPYLHDAETFIATDAYKEFAAVPYETVKKLRDKYDRQRVFDLVTHPETPDKQRSLYCLMLGLTGTDADAPAVWMTILRVEDKPQLGLDALLACYLMLTGEAGLKEVETRYLASSQAKFTQTSAAVAAIRFHGNQEEKIPRARLRQSLYLLFERIELTDLVINDLIEWEDWTVADKLVELFKRPKEQSQFLRTHVVRYLKARPLPDSMTKIEELRRVDPDAVSQAEVIIDQGIASRALAEKQAEKKTEKKKAPSSAEKSSPETQAETQPQSASEPTPQASVTTPPRATTDEPTTSTRSGTSHRSSSFGRLALFAAIAALVVVAIVYLSARFRDAD